MEGVAERLLDVAVRAVEERGPGALQARALTAEVGVSTQAVYTLFGGMPGLFVAVADEGFLRMADHVRGAPTTADAVADHLLKGLAYRTWAVEHPHLYRLMFGVAGADTQPRRGRAAVASAARVPAPDAALEVLVASVQAMIDAGRIRAAEAAVVARQFLAATHGHVMLRIAGGPTLGDVDDIADLADLADLGSTLLLGLGDEPSAVQRSMQLAVAAISAVHG